MLEKLIESYKSQKETFASHIVAFGLSTGVAALASNLSSDLVEGNLASSIVGTVSAMGVYWPTFIGGLVYKDRSEFKTDDDYNLPKIKEKVVEYVSWIGLGELAYGVARTGLHTYLQQEGYSSEVASGMADTTTAMLYTLGLPFIQMGVDQVKKIFSKMKTSIGLD